MLVIGAYMMSKLVAQNDPMLFFYGDGAGAAVLTGSRQARLRLLGVPGRRLVQRLLGHLRRRNR